MSYLLDIALVNISLDHVLHIHVSRLLNGTRFRSKQPSKQRMKRVGSKQRAYLGMERSLKRSFNTPIKDYLCKGRPPRYCKKNSSALEMPGPPSFLLARENCEQIYVTTTGCPSKSQSRFQSSVRLDLVGTLSICCSCFVTQGLLTEPPFRQRKII